MLYRYDILWRQQGDDAWQHYGNTTEREFKIWGLSAKTWYQIQVAAYSGEGAGSFTKYAGFRGQTTAATPPAGG